MSSAVSLFGIALSATGAAHFVAPDVFKGITEAAFPTDTKAWTYRDGAIELTVGAAIAHPKTRKIGFVGLAAYVGWLGFNIVKNR